MLADSIGRSLEEFRDGSGFGMVPLGAIPIKKLPDVASCFAAVSDLVQQGKRAAVLTSEGRFIDSHEQPELFAGVGASGGPICSRT